MLRRSRSSCDWIWGGAPQKCHLPQIRPGGGQLASIEPVPPHSRWAPPDPLPPFIRTRLGVPPTSPHTHRRRSHFADPGALRYGPNLINKGERVGEFLATGLEHRALRRGDELHVAGTDRVSGGDRSSRTEPALHTGRAASQGGGATQSNRQRTSEAALSTAMAEVSIRRVGVAENK